jgi:hypothetical protein
VEFAVDYQQMIESMTPDIYKSLKRAVELGKWPDGQRLTSEQRHNSLTGWGTSTKGTRMVTVATIPRRNP